MTSPLRAVRVALKMSGEEGRKEGRSVSSLPSAPGQWQSCHLVTLQLLWPKCAFSSQTDNDFWGGWGFSFFFFSILRRNEEVILGPENYLDIISDWCLLFFFFQFSLFYCYTVAMACLPLPQARFVFVSGLWTGGNIYTHLHMLLERLHSCFSEVARSRKCLQVGAQLCHPWAWEFEL